MFVTSSWFSGRFSTLLAAVSAAAFEKALDGKGPFTMFAPTNKAFAKIPSAALADLLANKAALTKVNFDVFLVKKYTCG
jgi:uncharacterized surface protein with fasciclin (FAS1) repeats